MFGFVNCGVCVVLLICACIVYLYWCDWCLLLFVLLVYWFGLVCLDGLWFAGITLDFNGCIAVVAVWTLWWVIVVCGLLAWLFVC